MTPKTETNKGIAKTGGAKGRPKGSKNLGGPLLSRLASKGEKQVMGYLERINSRSGRWAAADESNRDVLLAIKQAAIDAHSLIGEKIIDPMLELEKSGWNPPKTAAAAIGYVGRQVWIKPLAKSIYVEGFEFNDEQLNNLFVVKMVGGKLLISVGKNGKVKIPVPKLHVSVKNPAEESQTV